MFNDQDLLLLSAYLDDELPPEERHALEARLFADDLLRDELDSLRQTVQLVEAMPIIPAPRNYTLDPALYGKKKVIYPWARVLSIAAVLVLVAGAVFLFTRANQREDETTSVALDQPQGGADSDSLETTAPEVAGVPTLSPQPPLPPPTLNPTQGDPAEEMFSGEMEGEFSGMNPPPADTLMFPPAPYDMPGEAPFYDESMPFGGEPYEQGGMGGVGSGGTGMEGGTFEETAPDMQAVPLPAPTQKPPDSQEGMTFSEAPETTDSEMAETEDEASQRGNVEEEEEAPMMAASPLPSATVARVLTPTAMPTTQPEVAANAASETGNDSAPAAASDSTVTSATTLTESFTLNSLYPRLDTLFTRWRWY